MAPEILFALLSDDTMAGLSQNGKNEISHELHNGCVHVCTKFPLECLFELSELLRSTNCEFGRLIVNGLSADSNKLSKLMPDLQMIKAAVDTQPCIKNQLAHVLQYKLKSNSSDAWPDLFNFLKPQ